MADTTDGWGFLADIEGFGRPDAEGDFEEVPYNEALGRTWGKQGGKPYRHAAHAFLYALDGKKVWGLYENKAVILMNMRVDGYIGFPGGIIDDGETPEEGLNRELEEEIGLDLTKHSFCKGDHLVSHVNHRKGMVLHFYCKRVTLEDCFEIEKSTLHAKEYGIEVLGSVRVPMFTYPDEERGLPIFLTNRFCGNSKEQLLMGIERMKIMTTEEIQLALKHSESYNKKFKL
ncbi:uncharacterized protein LOC106179942 [Lingula anatina]|uniref:U8 snoRNA-decapping enzyme n=1 Tax=Lingula anatina TaxID=7574 RepID=A0A1S3K9A6_LINAN|nr:uncharacterized protein LOC106179942 [Lingula anatina]|eukprot:XP_013419208.1 uncharacterized protein LOC106179942 [Lingula anatina]